MRVSKLFGKTLRDDPADAEVASHRLMLKAGMIHQAAAGIYSYLPLAWRSLRKIEQIIREEMDVAGGQEVRLSALQPRELWDASGRTEILGPQLFQLEDRRDRPLVLAPTHEELLLTMVKANVHSYRDLPMILYQIQTKFRDEPRPRAGLMRVREFDMKDAYSFDIDEDGLDVAYQAMVRAYRKIYARCGLDAIMVEADSGAIGGKDSHEFVLLADSGEDTVLLCEACGYAANAERAAFTKPPLPEEEPLPLEEVHTPGVTTIDGLAEFLGISAAKTFKAVFYMADGEFVFVAIRGDLDVNEVKLRNALAASELRLATPAEVESAGIVAGSASPVGLSGVRTVVDDSVHLGSNFVVGANRHDYHLRNANYPRDFKADMVADIALAEDGYICPSCDSRLKARRGIEVGHVFKLGTRYSEPFGAYFPDADGNDRPIIMGCYGIGVGRMLAAAIEQHHDDKGIKFPAPIAPYHASLVALNVADPEVVACAEDVYARLGEAGIEVLYDDRSETAGVKFNDADLLGLPLRIVVSARNLAQDAVEVKGRSESVAAAVPKADIVDRVREMLSGSYPQEAER
ncbi:MAG: proline--tRNA ligase [Chloroflexi bacterium]|nr:proline--tRNA ligase [Chloroflexota bacterium]